MLWNNDCITGWRVLKFDLANTVVASYAPAFPLWPSSPHRRNDSTPFETRALGHGETHLEVKEDALHIDNMVGRPAPQERGWGFPALLDPVKHPCGSALPCPVKMVKAAGQWRDKKRHTLKSFQFRIPIMKQHDNTKQCLWSWFRSARYIWLTSLNATEIKVSSAIANDFNQLIRFMCPAPPRLVSCPTRLSSIYIYIYIFQ